MHAMPHATPIRPAVRRALRCLLGCAVVLAILARPSPTAAQAFETIFYMTESDASWTSFEAHVEQIDVVAPQVFAALPDGRVEGRVDPAVLRLAAEHGVRVMPLIHNRGFVEDDIHALLHDLDARARVVATMVELGRRDGFWGWQFDFEHIAVTDRDSLTAFYRQTATALHDAGMILSIAVVPSSGRVGSTPWHRYMHDHWHGAFDLRALAEIGDFISLMTYLQHNAGTPPGPVAGLPWMRATLEHTLDAGVPPERISLGLPSYSAYWAPGYDTTRTGTEGFRPVHRGVHHDEAVAMLHRHDATLQWLPRQGTSMAFWEHEGVFHYLFLEDARAFRAKLALFEDYPGLRGISVWVLGAEDEGVWRAEEDWTR